MFKFVKAFVKTKTIEMSLENLIYLDFTKDTISQNVIEYIQDRILIEEEKEWSKKLISGKNLKNAEANKLVQSIVSAMIINSNGVSEEIKPIA